MEQAASGLEALQVMPRFQPHLVFMDLAMPGIDGWETIRRIRRDRLGEPRIAIISANAFDKGLDNDLGVPAADFMTKPVRVNHLLDWVGEALTLTWVWAEPSAPVAVVPPPATTLPAPERLRALAELAELGYLRGLLDQLAEIDALDAGHGEFTARLRTLARQFQFDAIKDLLANVRPDPP
jgi:CheY-like chemotaxis protein